MKKSLYNDFRNLIENGSREPPLQDFLKEHPEILTFTFNQGAHYPTVFPKFHLTDEFVPDFVMIGHRSVWSWDVDLIEIEPAVCDRPLFNSKHQSASRLRDAEAQITSWQAWMQKYKDSVFVPRALEKLRERKAWDDKPEYYCLSEGTYQSVTVWYRVVIGRRPDFQGWGDKYRNIRWKESGNRIEIVPWDRLLEKAELLQ